MGNDASWVTVVCVQRVPGSSPGMGEGTDVKLYCCIDAVDPDHCFFFMRNGDGDMNMYWG